MSNESKSDKPSNAALIAWCKEMAAWCETEDTPENARQFSQQDTLNWLECAERLTASSAGEPMLSAAAVERCAAIVDQMQEAWHDSDEPNSGHYMDAAHRIAEVLRERAKHPPFSTTQSATGAVEKRSITRSSCACEVGDDDIFIEKCALHSGWLKALLDIALCRMNKDGRRGAVTMEVFGPWAPPACRRSHPGRRIQGGGRGAERPSR